MNFRIAATALLGLSLVATAVVGQDRDPRLAEIERRQALMTLIGMSYGPLRAMDKGDMPYNAEVAAMSAKNLAVMASFDQSTLWTPGADRTLTEDSETLASIFDDPDLIARVNADMKAAADELAMVAGDGL
ncbi:MAG: cytochrome c, partial [Rhodobacteraceae bacterium]|nr:cytochrome c [Paracoccaceae bacterium]